MPGICEYIDKSLSSMKWELLDQMGIHHVFEEDPVPQVQ
jgi:hypothetical protein